MGSSYIIASDGVVLSVHDDPDREMAKKLDVIQGEGADYHKYSQAEARELGWWYLKAFTDLDQIEKEKVKSFQDLVDRYPPCKDLLPELDTDQDCTSLAAECWLRKFAKKAYIRRKFFHWCLVSERLRLAATIFHDRRLNYGDPVDYLMDFFPDGASDDAIWDVVDALRPGGCETPLDIKVKVVQRRYMREVNPGP